MFSCTFSLPLTHQKKMCSCVQLLSPSRFNKCMSIGFLSCGDWYNSHQGFWTQSLQGYLEPSICHCNIFLNSILPHSVSLSFVAWMAAVFLPYFDTLGTLLTYQNLQPWKRYSATLLSPWMASLPDCTCCAYPWCVVFYQCIALMMLNLQSSHFSLLFECDNLVSFNFF